MSMNNNTLCSWMQMPLTQSLLVFRGVWAILCSQVRHYMTESLPKRLHWSLLVLLEINMYLGTFY